MTESVEILGQSDAEVRHTLLHVAIVAHRYDCRCRRIQYRIRNKRSLRRFFDTTLISVRGLIRLRRCYVYEVRWLGLLIRTSGYASASLRHMQPRLISRMRIGGEIRSSPDAVDHVERLRRSGRSLSRRSGGSSSPNRSIPSNSSSADTEIPHRLLPTASRSNRVVPSSRLYSLAIFPSGEIGHGATFAGILDAGGGSFILAG